MPLCALLQSHGLRCSMLSVLGEVLSPQSTPHLLTVASPPFAGASGAAALSGTRPSASRLAATPVAMKGGADRTDRRAAESAGARQSRLQQASGPSPSEGPAPGRAGRAVSAGRGMPAPKRRAGQLEVICTCSILSQLSLHHDMACAVCGVICVLPQVLSSAASCSAGAPVRGPSTAAPALAPGSAKRVSGAGRFWRSHDFLPVQRVLAPTSSNSMHVNSP